MKLLILLFLLPSIVFATFIELSAFTGVEVCHNHEGTNNEEMCATQLNYEPNVKIRLVDGHGKIEVDHSQYNIPILTVINVSKNETNITINLESLNPKTNEAWVKGISVSMESASDLRRTVAKGEKVCQDQECNIYLKPFLYLGQPFIESY